MQIFSRYVKNANKLHFKCTDFNSSMRVTVYAECIGVNRLSEIIKHTKA